MTSFRSYIVTMGCSEVPLESGSQRYPLHIFQAICDNVDNEPTVGCSFKVEGIFN